MTPDQHDDIPRYISRELCKAVEASGYPILGYRRDAFPGDWTLLYATPDQPAHIIEYGLSGQDHYRHMQLNAALKVQWIWAEPNHQRMVAYLSPGKHP